MGVGKVQFLVCSMHLNEYPSDYRVYDHTKITWTASTLAFFQIEMTETNSTDVCFLVIKGRISLQALLDTHSMTVLFCRVAQMNPLMIEVSI